MHHARWCFLSILRFLHLLGFLNHSLLSTWVGLDDDKQWETVVASWSSSQSGAEGKCIACYIFYLDDFFLERKQGRCECDCPLNFPFNPFFSHLSSMKKMMSWVGLLLEVSSVSITCTKSDDNGVSPSFCIRITTGLDSQTNALDMHELHGKSKC